MNQSQALLKFLESFAREERKQKIQSILDQRTRHMTLVLEDIFQPQNSSAVLRSSDCFGVQDLHILESYNTFQKLKGVALGSDKWLTLKRYQNTAEENVTQCFADLKQRGYRVVATSPHPDGDRPCHDLESFPIDTPFALVFGSEKPGITQKVRNEVDCFVRVPMYGFTESYNISVCVALCLYELTRRLRASDVDWKIPLDEQVDIKLDWIKKSIPNADALERRFFQRDK